MSLRFPAVKLLDYRKRWAELETSQSPFAVVVMAHLESLRTRRDVQGRKAAKLGLVRELYRKGYSRRDVRQLFRFIDWVMTLPEELEEQFRTEVRALEEEKHMPYVTSIERLGRKEALEEGLKKGLAKGLKKGLEKGCLKGLLDAIRVSLKVRFGKQGLALMPELQSIQDEAVLIRIQEALVRGLSLEELRKIWQG